MIIILGPDHSGKSTLAKALNMPYVHYDKDSIYSDYLPLLANLSLYDAVLDRHAICEYPYHKVMDRKFAFTMKEWHNILLLTLIQKPLVVLCTHKPLPYEYSPDQYLPYDKWDECLLLYKDFLTSHCITHVRYDYTGPVTPNAIKLLHDKYAHTMDWWKAMWIKGWGCIGSANPKVLLVAERLGPNNVNNLPFETGPTGLMLSDMFAKTGTPLNKVTVTNLVKDVRRSTRPPNDDDLRLLRWEVENLAPERIVFMGTPARRGAKVAQELGIECYNIVHLGYHNYKKTRDMTPYYNSWKELMGIT